MQQIVTITRLIGRNMDRSSSTKKTHYVFEKNNQPTQANQDKSKIENDKNFNIRNLAVKKEYVMTGGKSHEFIIFYESESFSAESLIKDPSLKLKKEEDTNQVKENFINLIRNKTKDESVIDKIKQSLFTSITVARPFNESEISTHNKLINISGKFNELSNNLTKVKLAKVEKEKALIELKKFQEFSNEKKLASDEVKNLLHKLDDKNLSDAELISLLKPISISIEKKEIEQALNDLGSKKEKISREEFTALKDKLAYLNEESITLKNAEDIKFFEDHLKTLENSSDEKSIALRTKLENTITYLKTKPRILEISKRHESQNIKLKASELLIAKNLFERKSLISKISNNELLTTEELKFFKKYVTDVTFDEDSKSFKITDKYLFDEMSDNEVLLFDQKLEILNKFPKNESLSKEERKNLKILIGESLSKEESTILKNLNLKKSLESKISEEKLFKIISDLNEKLDGYSSIKSNRELVSDIHYLLFENLNLTRQLNELNNTIKSKLSDTELNALIAELGIKSDQKLSSLKIGLKIKPDNEKIEFLINKLKMLIASLDTEIPKLESELQPIQESKTSLEKIFDENNKASKKEGKNINLTDANLFYEHILENAKKFGIEIRENTSQSYKAKASESTETESITNQSDSNDLSDKENISSDTNNKSKITVKTELSSQTWSKVNASSPRKSEKFLTSKQITANSSNLKTITEANIQKQIIASSDESSNSELSSFSEDESKENITNQAQSNTISTRSARDVGKDLLINPNNLKKPNN